MTKTLPEIIDDFERLIEMASTYKTANQSTLLSAQAALRCLRGLTCSCATPFLAGHVCGKCRKPFFLQTRTPEQIAADYANKANGVRDIARDVEAADNLPVKMLAALKAWERWYSEDSTEFNRECARELGLNAIAIAEGR